jgi:hypothetical protein
VRKIDFFWHVPFNTKMEQELIWAVIKCHGNSYKHELLITTKTFELATQFCKDAKAKFSADFGDDPLDEDYIEELRDCFQITVISDINKYQMHGDYYGFILQPVHLVHGDSPAGYVLK